MTPAQRGEVWWVDLGEPTGFEQAGSRPAVVLQTNHLLRLSTVVVVPVTTQTKHAGFAGTVEIGPGETGLTFPSVALCYQIRALDRSKLKRKIGNLPPEKLSEVELAVAFVCGISA